MKYKARYEAPLTTVEEKESEKPLPSDNENKPEEKKCDSSDKNVPDCILKQIDLCITVLSMTKDMLSGLLSCKNEEND